MDNLITGLLFTSLMLLAFAVTMLRLESAF